MKLPVDSLFIYILFLSGGGHTCRIFFKSSHCAESCPENFKVNFLNYYYL